MVPPRNNHQLNQDRTTRLRDDCAASTTPTASAVALTALADTTFLVPDIIFNEAQLLIEPTILTPNDMRTLLTQSGG